MTEAEWRGSGAPDVLLNACWVAGSARKKRLFGCACCRLAIHLCPGERFHHALGVAERFAEGDATPGELARAGAAVTSNGFLRTLCSPDPTDVRRVWEGVTETLYRAGTRWHAQLDRTCDLVRDIFGNPFRPVAFNPAWRTSTAVALASQMYESRDFSPMPILADALQDAGCEHPDILTHCRGDGVHVRGCWVVDLVLGKA